VSKKYYAGQICTGKRQIRKIDFEALLPKIPKLKAPEPTKSDLVNRHLANLTPMMANKILSVIREGNAPRDPPDRTLGKPLAWGYTRVSSEEQKQKGLSIEFQSRQALDFYGSTLAEQGVAWDGFLADEAVSAYKKMLFARPFGCWLFEHMRPGDHVIILRCDRVFRGMNDQEHCITVFMDRGVNLHLLDAPIPWDTANGKMILQIMRAMAQWESSIKSERTKAGKAIAREIGYYPGGKCGMGYRREQRKDGRWYKIADWPARTLIWAIWSATQEVRDKGGHIKYDILDIATRFRMATIQDPNIQRLIDASAYPSRWREGATTITYAIAAFKRIMLAEGRDWIDQCPVLVFPPMPKWQSEASPIIKCSRRQEPFNPRKKMGKYIRRLTGL